METIACIFCHSSKGNVVITESGFAGKKCHQCALIYIAQRPAMQEVIDLYGHEQAHISAQSHITASYFKYLHSRHTLNLLKKYRKSGKLLEIGAGGGFFLEQARKAGFEPYAIELNPTQAQFIHHTLAIDCEQQPLSSHSFGTTTFDIIYHNDVISHFHNPQEVFAIMHSKLNPGGIMLFETGNLGDVDKKYYRFFDSFQYPDHLFFFGKTTINQLLVQNQFIPLASYAYTITLHLVIMRLISYLTKSKSIHSQRSVPFAEQPQYRIKKYVKSMYHALLYCARYKLGALLPKHKAPQTMIVIAKKQEYSEAIMNAQTTKWSEPS